MKNLRILVDSARQQPKPGEMAMLFAEGTKDGVHFMRAELQQYNDILFEWQPVPIEFFSHRIGLNIRNPKPDSLIEVAK